MADLDLEELKRLVAEMSERISPEMAKRDVAIKLVLASVDVISELIARVERAEAVLQEAIGRAEEIIERANAQAEAIGSDTEERAYFEGRMEAAIAISNILTGDTPNV